MFTGMVKLEGQSPSSVNTDRMPAGTWEVESVLPPAGSRTRRKKLHRRPGYMRGGLQKQLEFSQGVSKRPCQRPAQNGEVYDGKGCQMNSMKTPASDSNSVPQHLSLSGADSASSLDSYFNESHSRLSVGSREKPMSPCALVPQEDCWPSEGASTPWKDAQRPECDCSSLSLDLELQAVPTPHKGGERPLASPGDPFNSSFSFIQMSLNSSYGSTCELSQQSPSLPCTLAATQDHTKAGLESPQPGKGHLFAVQLSWESGEGEGYSLESGLKESLPDSDSFSLDAEATFSLSVDSSDAASAGSSVTSGYESSTPCSDQGWEALMKKYEAILQDCLQNNRTNIKIESMMLKLQRLQQKAILEDDYDKAERFQNKLDELRREKSFLKVGLPSKHPVVSRFVERLKDQVHCALHQASADSGSSSGESQSSQNRAQECSRSSESQQCPPLRKDRLLQEQRQIQKEIQDLQRKLVTLEARSSQLECEILEEERLMESDEGQVLPLLSCPTTQLLDLGKTLDDLVDSEHRARLCTHLPPYIQRLQEQEQALTMSIREATAKVFMSQRLCSSLRKKVSESETQLLTLHEAKLAAISGSHFTTAKELKVEIKSLYSERDRLEGLIKKMQALSVGNQRDLEKIKEDYRMLKQELGQKEAEFEKTLKDNAVKYIELLEDKLNSCGSQAVERVWEADLEACQLLLRGLKLRAAGSWVSEVEDSRTGVSEPLDDLCHPTETKKNPPYSSSMDWGGGWSSKADLNHCQVTKKLDEFLFCIEDNQPETFCTSTIIITEQCESISDKLLSLEDQLQTAILHRDEDLTQSLQREIQTVKGTLQTMLLQLTSSDAEERDTEDFYSDSW
ncbi:disrupted in schizophrenia 1 protein [Amia ocellicauda]|uniref:disrupted in schizophrenia 1 protein n=1 Tax=Amia ocellicauda TaxID=2972642 RepID=UPI003464080B